MTVELHTDSVLGIEEVLNGAREVGRLEWIKEGTIHVARSRGGQLMRWGMNGYVEERGS